MRAEFQPSPLPTSVFSQQCLQRRVLHRGRAACALPVRVIVPDNGFEWTARAPGADPRRPSGRHLIDWLCQARGSAHRMPPAHQRHGGTVQSALERSPSPRRAAPAAPQRVSPPMPPAIALSNGSSTPPTAPASPVLITPLLSASCLSIRIIRTSTRNRESRGKHAPLSSPKMGVGATGRSPLRLQGKTPNLDGDPALLRSFRRGMTDFTTPHRRHSHGSGNLRHGCLPAQI